MEVSGLEPLTHIIPVEGFKYVSHLESQVKLPKELLNQTAIQIVPI